MTINSFLAAGNDGFPTLAGGTDATTDGTDLEALIGYLMGHPSLAPPPADRITRID